MPILRILYAAQESNSHHIYMALIVLLVLSEDDNFNKAVHETVWRVHKVQGCNNVMPSQHGTCQDTIQYITTLVIPVWIIR